MNSTVTENAIVSDSANEISDPHAYSYSDRIDLKIRDRAAKRWRLLSFLLFVVLPSLIISYYFAFVASNQYISEVRFVVRTIGISAEIGGDEDVQPSLISQSLSQDGHIAANFVESIELVERLQNKLDLRKLFADPQLDYFSRLEKDATLEELFQYWKKQVSTYVDGPSGIIVFSIRAFDPNDAKLIADAVLTETSQLVDQISERAKQDLVERAEQEVKKASVNYQNSLVELQNYQNETGILDPFSNAEVLGRLLSELIAERLKVEAQLNVLIANNVQDSPRKRQLEKLLASLDQQIKRQRNSLAGTDAESDQLSEALVGFSRLATVRLVTEAIYESAREILDLSKSAALRRTTYVSVFSPAKEPEKSEYPKRFSSALMAIIGLFVIWSSLLLLRASIDDHRR